jgi:hypothetical protein
MHVFNCLLHVRLQAQDELATTKAPLSALSSTKQVHADSEAALQDLVKQLAAAEGRAAQAQAAAAAATSRAQALEAKSAQTVASRSHTGSQTHEDSNVQVEVPQQQPSALLAAQLQLIDSLRSQLIEAAAARGEADHLTDQLQDLRQQLEGSQEQVGSAWKGDVEFFLVGCSCRHWPGLVYQVCTLMFAQSCNLITLLSTL